MFKRLKLIQLVQIKNYEILVAYEKTVKLKIFNGINLNFEYAHFLKIKNKNGKYRYYIQPTFLKLKRISKELFYESFVYLKNREYTFETELELENFYECYYYHLNNRGECEKDKRFYCSSIKNEDGFYLEFPKED